MEGIVGVWNQDTDTDNTRAVVSDMLKHLNTNGGVCQNISSTGPLSMGTLQLKAWMAKSGTNVTEEDGLMVAVDGEIYDRASLAASLDLPYSAHINDAAFVAAGYRQSGLRIISRLNGRYAIAIWSAKERVLHLITDLLGTRYLYLYRSGHKVYFSSAIRAMLADEHFKPELNWTGVAQHFCLDYLLGEHTLIKNVELLPGHTITSITETSVTRQKYWSFPTYESGRFKGMKSSNIVHEMHNEYLDMAENIRSNEGSPCIGLTGGLDTRLISAYIAPVFSSLQSATLGYPGSYDIRIAVELAKTLKSSHHTYINTDNANYFIENMSYASVVTEGIINTVDFLLIGEKLAQHGDIAYMGSLGSELSGLVPYSRFMDIENLRDLNSLAHYVCQHKAIMTPKKLQELSSGTELSAAADDIENQLYGSLQETPGNSINERLAVHELMNRQRRRTLLPMHLVGEHIRCRFPLLERRSLFEAFLQLPWELRHDRKIYKLLLSRYFPILAEFDTGVRRLPVKWELHLSQLYRYRDKAYYLIKRHFPMLVERLLSSSNLTADVNATEEVYRKQYRNELVTLLVKEGGQRKIWNPAVVKQMIDDHATRKRNYRQVLHKLIALEYFLRDIEARG